MRKLSELNNTLVSDIIAQHVSETKKITIEEARKFISKLSFSEYVKLSENIVPPSGQTIGPATQKSTQTQKAPTASTGPEQMKAIWPGQGAPVEVGMTVGLTDTNGLPVPGEVSQVDKSANGVKVKNPTTGKDEWLNTKDLQPFAVQQNEMQDNLKRLKELAGISENCSGGATGAGAIAISPVSLGKMKKREATKEMLKKEYTPKGPAKTIIGDTKPNQASGELSATLAANGKKTASRINNGIKRR